MLRRYLLHNHALLKRSQIFNFNYSATKNICFVYDPDDREASDDFQIFLDESEDYACDPYPRYRRVIF
jgi:glycosylphosphatidylinositol transamidase (GPIT) subunit GPI8